LGNSARRIPALGTRRRDHRLGARSRCCRGSARFPARQRWTGDLSALWLQLTRYRIMDWSAIGLTLRLATLTTCVLAVVGLPLAYWLAQSRWRWKFLVEAVVALPLVLPPTVLGFYLLLALGPRSPLGQGWLRATGETLAFSFPGLLIASVLYSLPFAVRPF